MKLAEAILERGFLEEKIKRLESRMLNDLDLGRPTSHLQEELQRTVNQARDIAISVSWTEQNSLMSGIPLGSYRIRIDYLINLAKIFEDVNPEKADMYWASACQDKKIVEAACWLIDLKIPVDDKKETN